MTVRDWLASLGKDLSMVPEELLEARIGNRIQVGKDSYRPGKFLGRLTRHLDLTKEEVASFFKLTESLGFTFGVARREQVFDVYNSYNIRSCMTGREYVEFYAYNPSVVGVAYLERDGEYYARAVLWLDRYYDNVYAADGTARSTLIQRLREAGYEPVHPDVVVKLRRVGFYPYVDTLYYAYSNPEEPGYLVLTGRRKPHIEYEGKVWTLHAYLRSTQGDYIPYDLDDVPRTCAVCGASPVVDQDSDGLYYCTTHAANLAWIYADGQVVRRARPSHYVLLSDGIYADPADTVLLATGERVHRSALPEGYVLVELGTYAGVALPEELVAEYQGKKVYAKDLINGELPSFLQYVKVQERRPSGKVMSLEL
ncbi:hypothetical protein P74p1 [Thermus phage P74-26]|uniref:Uncharacterized protein n=1 Tax=Thermus phage P74-26 TaxID=2914007 RepID=A7XXF9_BP742|nr:hypothetical protein P74p1 [Thermus phage P74-26]ABU96951.1 hypothetical protein P74p1 [Thermus phage P74-26]